MTEIVSEVEQTRHRQVIRLTGFMITGPNNISETAKRNTYVCISPDARSAEVRLYASVIQGIDVITIGREFNAGKVVDSPLRTSMIDLIVSRNSDGVWVAELYVDVGVDYKDLIEIYGGDTLEMILESFGMNVELLPVYELSSPGEVFVIEPAIRPTGEEAVVLPTYNVATYKITGSIDLARGKYVRIGLGHYMYGSQKIDVCIFCDLDERSVISVYARKLYLVPLRSQILGDLTEVQ